VAPAKQRAKDRANPPRFDGDPAIQERFRAGNRDGPRTHRRTNGAASALPLRSAYS